MDILHFNDKGIYCVPGDFYIDPWKPVDKALITHGHADHARWGMKSYLCHHFTVPILHSRIGKDIHVEGIGYNETRNINGVKVSFHPAGHIIGSAQIRLGAEPFITVYVAPSEEARKQAGLNDIDIVEAVDYYTTPRGQHACSPNKLLFSGLAAAVGFDAFHLAEHLLTQPLHIVVGDKVGAFGSYKDGFELFNKAASDKKSIQVVAGASHYDLYDQPEPTGKALEQIIPFFKEHLA